MIKQILKDIELELTILYKKEEIINKQIHNLTLLSNDHCYVNELDDIMDNIHNLRKKLNKIEHKIAILEINKERYTKCLSSK